MKYQPHRKSDSNYVLQAVHKMSFSRDSYSDLVARYNQQPGAVDKIACEWLVHNKEIWMPWIPTSDEKNVLYIGGIFPITGSPYSAKGIVRGEKECCKI
jgi:hypothetical protein